MFSSENLLCFSWKVTGEAVLLEKSLDSALSPSSQQTEDAAGASLTSGSLDTGIVASLL